MTVQVDPNVFCNQQGTVTAQLQLQSGQAVNIIPPVRVLINSQQPAQRGTFVDIPGTLVDVLPDPTQNRFYVLRQDLNQVLVFDGSNNTQIATLRTKNVPKGMAITFDQQYLLVGHDSSQYISVFNLQTLQAVSRSGCLAGTTFNPWPPPQTRFWRSRATRRAAVRLFIKSIWQREALRAYPVWAFFKIKSR